MISGKDFLFWQHIDEYGVFDDFGNLVGIKEDSPEEIKKSWEEYQKVEVIAREKNLKG